MSDVVPFKIERQDDGELRISETELARRLGYKREREFRSVISKHRARIDRMGRAATLRETAQNSQKHTRLVMWFTEQQAVFLVSRSGTEVADDIMEAMAVQFVAMRKKLASDFPPITKELLALNILSPEVRVWERHFEKPFFDNLHRVLGLKKPGRNNHPNCGHFINRFVYGFLFGTLGLEVIRDANPKKVVRLRDDGTAEYVRAYRHHQMLKAEHEPVFQQHIRTLNTILGLSNGVQHFEDQFNAHFQQHETQIGFAFNEVRARLATKEPANV